MKRTVSLLLCVLLLLTSSTACTAAPQKYQGDFADSFDTQTIFIGYANSEKEFAQYAAILHDEMSRLHKLFDIYHDYEGINNLKTVNDNAGVRPVQVEADIIDLLLLCVDAYDVSHGTVNVAMGSVLSLWHRYRTEGIAIPSEAELLLASQYTDISQLIIDEAEQTVYLTQKGMSLDVGAVAKGYAAKKAVELTKQAGLTSGIVSAGGNVITVGKPQDGIREVWGVGIQDPEQAVDGNQNLLSTVYVRDLSVVSSGNYQRYYLVDGQYYHHIIDPDTLFPANRFLAVSVICEDSGMADMLSTAMFILPQEEGRALLDAYQAEGIWVLPDSTIITTPNYPNTNPNPQ